MPMLSPQIPDEVADQPNIPRNCSRLGPESSKLSLPLVKTL